MVDDAALLTKFIADRSEEALRSFVERHVDFVYAAALRQAGGDPHLAREIAQNVFIDVARKAGALSKRTSVLGWLHLSTRVAARALMRARARRTHHEHEAAAMHEILSIPGREETNWEDLRPLIDDALAELDDPDREAILLRHFDGRSFAAVGVTLGLGENAARMRVERAVEKLRRRLARRGITSTAAALAATLASQPMVAAPAGMAAAIAGASLAAPVAASGGFAGYTLVRDILYMNTGKTALVTLGLIIALGLGHYWGSRLSADHPSPESIGALQTAVGKLEADNRRLQAVLAREETVASGAGTPSADLLAAITPLQRLQAMVEMQEKEWGSASSPYFEHAYGKLTPGFVGLFALTPTEQDKMLVAIRRAREKLATLELANGRITRDANGEITLSVQPFPIEGGKVLDETMKAFAAILGPERNDAFRRMHAKRFEEAFGSFGVDRRTYVFGHDQSASDRPFTFRYMTVTGGDRDGVTDRRGGSSFGSFDEMAASLGPIVNFLPSDYRQAR